MKIICYFTLALLLSGCASSRWGESGGSLCDSQITQLGPDTYMSSAVHGNGCGIEYKVRHAGIFCGRMGKQILVKNIDNSTGGNVIFQCLSSGDTDLHRPTYQKEPDIIIKHE